MRKKQPRQRIFNEKLPRQDPLNEQQRFISYSNNLRKKEQNEMKILQKMDYCHTQLSIKKKDSDIFLFLRQKGKQQIKKQTLLNSKSSLDYEKKYNGKDDKKNKNGNRNGKKGNESNEENYKIQKPQQYNQIDNCAVVIKGKLIYLKQDTGEIKSNDHLLYFLHQNNISYKQYLSGNQKQILKKISSNQSQKQNEIIKDYILRNMSEQNNGEILIMERFHQIKNKLFD